eukprot:5377734-Amphidinium_carterae.1
MPTVTGRVAMQQGKARAVQSQRAGGHHCFTSAEHNPQLHYHLLKLNSTLCDKQQLSIELKHNTSNKFLTR